MDGYKGWVGGKPDWCVLKDGQEGYQTRGMGRRGTRLLGYIKAGHEGNQIREMY